jgi:hypothetical protein
MIKLKNVSILKAATITYELLKKNAQMIKKEQIVKIECFYFHQTLEHRFFDNFIKNFYSCKK